MRKAFLSAFVLIALIFTGCASPTRNQQARSSGQATAGSKGQVAYRLRMEGRGDIQGTAIQTATEYCRSQGKPFNFIKDEVGGVSMFGLWTIEYELYFNCGEEEAPAIADYGSPENKGESGSFWRKVAPKEAKQARPARKRAPATEEATRTPQKARETEEVSRRPQKARERDEARRRPQRTPTTKEASRPPVRKEVTAPPEEAKKETAKAVPMRAKPSTPETPTTKEAGITPATKPTPAAPEEAKKEAASPASPPAPPPAKTAAAEFQTGPKSIDISNTAGAPETLGFQDSGDGENSLGTFGPGIIIEEVIIK